MSSSENKSVKMLKKQEKVEDTEEGRKVLAASSVLPMSTPQTKMETKLEKKQKISPPKRAPMLANFSGCKSIEKNGGFVVSQDIDSESSLNFGDLRKD